jgi:hypothetical protein
MGAPLADANHPADAATEKQKAASLSCNNDAALKTG